MNLIGVAVNPYVWNGDNTKISSYIIVPEELDEDKMNNLFEQESLYDDIAVMFPINIENIKKLKEIVSAMEKDLGVQKEFIVYSPDGFTEGKDHEETENAQIVEFLNAKDIAEATKKVEESWRGECFNEFIIVESVGEKAYLSLEEE